MEEIFPLVNEYGTVIGQASRKECHNGSKLLHPVIHLHIFNSEGKLFLQKRSEKKDIQPNKWDSSVGGHIDLGETPKESAIREAREEIGLSSYISIQYVTKYIIETDREKELTYCFFTETDLLPKIDMNELADGKFWTLDEIQYNIGDNIFTPNFELDFRLFLAQGVESLRSMKFSNDNEKTKYYEV